jgi:outer membrane receptor protein involved in Fe transport
MALNKRTRQRALWTTALLASSMLTGVAAHAQEASAVALDEVVVTAQKRSENLQDVPVSIQALGEAKLEELQVSNFTDYVKYLPSVSFQTTSPGFSNVYFRGVASGGDGNHSGSLPSVGVYLDEQPVTTIQGALDIHIYDIARVEALSGPQGTLYGASSQAGTLRIITNKPSTAGFSAGYDLEANTIAHGDAGYVVEGFVNQPVNDKVAVRLVGWAEHQGGYIDNVAASRTYPTSGVTVTNADRVKKDYNDVDLYGGRAAVRVELGDNWVATPTIMGQIEKVGGIFAEDRSLGALKVGHYYPENSDDRWWQAALTLEGKISNLDVTYAGSYLDRDVDTRQDFYH